MKQIENINSLEPRYNINWVASAPGPQTVFFPLNLRRPVGIFFIIDELFITEQHVQIIQFSIIERILSVYCHDYRPVKRAIFF